MLLSAFPSFSSNEKVNKKNALAVYFDNKNSTVDFYSMENWDKATVVHTSKPFKSPVFSDNFYNELKSAVGDYVAAHSDIVESYITAVLPDTAVSMNTVSIPNMGKKRNDDVLSATITGLYKNFGDLIINKFLAAQTKQVMTYSLSVINDGLLEKVKEAFKEGGLDVHCVTFAANCAGNAVSVLSSKLKSESYLLLDIKEDFSRFVFVAKGKTSGYYSLPFGYSILQSKKLAAEDMLFDHDVAELAVLNAREKAKAKQLTMMRQETLDEDSTEEDKLDAMFGNDEDASLDPTANANAVVNIKSLPKKQPRKLPQFMLRPLPHTDEEYGYENFRIFEKWALNLIASNDKLVLQGKPDKIYVNMPGEFEYLFEMVNTESEENGIEFAPLELHGANETISSYLEMFGGLYAGQYNKSNNFL